MNRKKFENLIKPYLSLKESDMTTEVNIGVDLDKIKTIGKNIGTENLYLNKNDKLYIYSRDKLGYIFIYTLEDKHYFFRTSKMNVIYGQLLLPGWNAEIPMIGEASPPHQYIERGYPISIMNGGKGWGIRYREVYELPITLSSRFINWQLRNPMEVKE